MLDHFFLHWMQSVRAGHAFDRDDFPSIQRQSGTRQLLIAR